MSNRLYENRIPRRITQYVLALQTGIPQSKISIIENELVTPKEGEKQKIAQALNLEVKDIFPMEITNERREN